MRSRFKKTLLILGLVASICFGLQASAFAANDLCPANAPDEVKNSEFCTDQADPVGGSGGLISDITNIVSIAAGIAAVVMIMVGGFKFITSNGDSGKVQEAKKNLTWSVIGLVVIVSARSIILFVITRV